MGDVSCIQVLFAVHIFIHFVFITGSSCSPAEETAVDSTELFSWLQFEPIISCPDINNLYFYVTLPNFNICNVR